MNEGEELDFAVRGVVVGGRVQLDAPLDAPDGTYVTITPYHNGDVPELTEYPRLTEAQIQWFRQHTERIRSQAESRRGGAEAA